MPHSYDDLIREATARVREIFPWELAPKIGESKDLLLIDVREYGEFEQFHIPNSLNVPRGVLEQACEWDYDETVPELAGRRDRPIIVICRSGKRSILAADVMLRMGFSDVTSLKLGVRGWNDSELALHDMAGTHLDPDQVDALLVPKLRDDQRAPKQSQ
ncbi:MAG: rhodanese-like domain-containing protein [Sideroxydans sp.]|jgi:rhodanese-related sulfurtransferase